jgi:ribosomal protein L37AE/L43A
MPKLVCPFCHSEEVLRVRVLAGFYYYKDRDIVEKNDNSFWGGWKCNECGRHWE